MDLGGRGSAAVSVWTIPATQAKNGRASSRPVVEAPSLAVLKDRLDGPAER